MLLCKIWGSSLCPNLSGESVLLSYATPTQNVWLHLLPIFTNYVLYIILILLNLISPTCALHNLICMCHCPHDVVKLHLKYYPLCNIIGHDRLDHLTHSPLRVREIYPHVPPLSILHWFLLWLFSSVMGVYLTTFAFVGYSPYCVDTFFLGATTVFDPKVLNIAFES